MKLEILDGLEVNERDIITFENGILGFEDHLKYILINNEELEDQAAFKLLQSIDDENIGFIVVYPYLLNENYEINLNDDVVDALELETSEDVVLYNIVTISENTCSACANMKSPIVINSRNRKAMQIVLENSDWPLKYSFKLDNKRP